MVTATSTDIKDPLFSVRVHSIFPQHDSPQSSRQNLGYIQIRETFHLFEILANHSADPLLQTSSSTMDTNNRFWALGFDLDEADPSSTGCVHDVEASSA